jgi:SpoVK/Ycf46/Vps4 family AAA+-type ATPase
MDKMDKYKDQQDRSVQMEVIYRELALIIPFDFSKLACEQSSTGILLWGPPGCGKSSIAHNLSSKFRPMYIIDNDKIVESVLQVFYSDIYNDIKVGAHFG